MISWYYVQGSERIGPVNEETLQDLFKKGVINFESYIWKKGFANWERLKDVSELNFSMEPVAAQEVTPEKKERKEERKAEKKEERKEDKKNEMIKEKAQSEKESSPEVIFHFDWKTIRSEDELFFIKIGHDRKVRPQSDLYGPYSLNELKEALEEKRINNHTWIFAPGMPGWIELGQTPLDPKNLNINTTNVLDEAPLLLVVNNDPLPLMTLIQVAGTEKCTLLATGPFQAGKVILGSIYAGTTLKAKNLKLTIEKFSPHEQKVFCSINEINESAKKIMQNYAN